MISKDISDITCRYIRVNGTRCGSPRLTDKQFCFWHNKVRTFHAEPNAPRMFPRYYHPNNSLEDRLKNHLNDQLCSGNRMNGPTSRDLPALEDPESIQLALSIVFGAIADNRVERKRASQLLYALKLATQNLRRLETASKDAIQNVIIDEFGLEVADTPLPEPPTEVVISTEGPKGPSGETPVLAPAQAQDNSPTLVENIKEAA